MARQSAGRVPDERRVRPASPLRLSTLLLVASGGAVGAVARYLLTDRFPEAGGGFPWTTFTINVAGSFLLALLAGAVGVHRHHWLPPLLGTGVLGGFTTLSAYSEQTRDLLADGSVLLAGAYLVGTLAACLAAVSVADRFSTVRQRAEFDDDEGGL